MRFITEFDSFNDASNFHYNESIANREFGENISNTFGRNNTNHRLEIEAFPMDKWIEFKNKLMDYLTECDISEEIPETLKVLKFIKELESFGKPAGDTITSK